jgi:hypothetical protein
MLRLKSICEKNFGFVVWQHRRKKKKKSHSQFVFCRIRLICELGKQSWQPGQSWPPPGHDIKAGLEKRSRAKAALWLGPACGHA